MSFAFGIAFIALYKWNWGFGGDVWDEMYI